MVLPNFFEQRLCSSRSFGTMAYCSTGVRLVCEEWEAKTGRGERREFSRTHFLLSFHNFLELIVEELELEGLVETEPLVLAGKGLGLVVKGSGFAAKWLGLAVEETAGYP